MLRFFVELLLVVLKRELELLDRFIACLDRLRAMPAEIVVRALEIDLCSLKRGDGLTNLWMPFTANSRGFLHRSSRLLRGDGKLIGRDR
jgi:hypothetical protein